jgi:uncharacterized protein (DUF3084 family)
MPPCNSALRTHAETRCARTPPPPTDWHRGAGLTPEELALLQREHTDALAKISASASSALETLKATYEPTIARLEDDNAELLEDLERVQAQVAEKEKEGKVVRAELAEAREQARQAQGQAEAAWLAAAKASEEQESALKETRGMQKVLDEQNKQLQEELAQSAALIQSMYRGRQVRTGKKGKKSKSEG